MSRLKSKFFLITIGLLCFVTIAYAAETIRILDSAGGSAVTMTQTSGAVTITGASSVNFGAANITTTGSVAYTGATVWNLESAQTLDPSSATVYWGMKDASNEEGRIYKLDSSHVVIYNDTAADGLALYTGGDTDDYILFTTTGNVPAMTATGACDLQIVTGAANYVDFTTGLLKFPGDEVLDQVTTDDVFEFKSNDEHTTIKITGYEAKEARLVMAADQGDDATDSFMFDVNTSGVLSIGNDQAVAGTFVDILTISNTGDVAILGTTPYLTIGDAGAEDAGIIMDGHSGGTDWYITSDDSADDLVIGTAAPASATNVMYFTTDHHTYITNGDATANAVEDVLTIVKETSGVAAAGIGIGISFEIEDEGLAAEQQASIDVVMTDTTNAGEEADIVFSQNSAGAIAETLRLVAANSATTGDYIKFTSNTTETDGILDLISLTTSAVVGAAGMGVGITLDYCDAGGAEEQGSIDHVLTTATNGAEMADFVFSTQTAGTVRETLRIVAASAATGADKLQFIANTTETNGIVDIMTLKADNSAGAGTTGLGAGISIHLDDAGGVEEQASIDFVLTDGVDAQEDCDIVFAQNVNGAMTEVLRIDADGGLDLSVGKWIGPNNDWIDNATTDNVITVGANATSTTFQILAPTGTSAIFSIDADAAEDNADTWTFTVADGGALTVANEGTATMTISEVVAFGSGTTIVDQVVTDAAAYTVLAANSGKVHMIADLTQNTAINLPAEADGLNYEFWYIGPAEEAHDHTITSEDDAKYFIGGVAHHDNDDGAVTAIASDGNSNSKFTINDARVGTIVKVTCDGTNWYITGSIISDTAPAFADQ